jgi:hypothetical protein
VLIDGQSKKNRIAPKIMGEVAPDTLSPVAREEGVSPHCSLMDSHGRVCKTAIDHGHRCIQVNGCSDPR